ncbi:hypothetical protein V8F20_009760 [Naviculisporaceae sp. PSN 640]
MHTMHARDASGRQVSLLNDDAPSYDAYPVPYQTTHHYNVPNTPELLRSDSYDSQMSSEPMTPITTPYDYAVGYGSGTAIADSRGYYDEYVDGTHVYATAKAPRYGSDRRSISYDEDAAPSPGADRSGKRYPCRYRDSHGCEKTFTTSGHASRHSKIHTAEKGVQCTHPGCSKKFTRADNMKQHLETHYKEKSSRSSSSRASLSSSDRKSSVSGKSSSRSKTSGTSGNTPLPSPGGVWDMRDLRGPLDIRPGASRTASGLDALAMAIACQEGS